MRKNTRDVSLHSDDIVRYEILPKALRAKVEQAWSVF